MAVDLEKLPGWPELEASVAGNPHALTIILSATVVALQAHASAQEKMIELVADVVARVVAEKLDPDGKLAARTLGQGPV